MVCGVEDPFARDSELEESILLPHHIELRVAIQEASRDELIKNTKCQGWQHGKEDVVQ